MAVTDWTAAEREAVSRMCSSEKKLDEGECLRWLRQKEGDETAALTGLREKEIFRAAWGLDASDEELVAQNPSLQVAHNSYTFPPVTDKQGAPVVLNLFGSLDIRGITAADSSFNYVRFSMTCLERGARKAQRAAAALGVPYVRITMVMDMAGMSSDHYTVKAFTNSFLTVLALQNQYYPLPYKKILVVRAPAAFSYAYSLATPFLSADLADVVQIPGEDWQSVLGEVVDLALWPTVWGGDLADPGPEWAQPLPPVDSALYVDAELPLEGATKVTVYPGDKHLVPLNDVAAGSTLVFRYKTSGEDVGFAVLHCDDDDGSSGDGDEKKTSVCFPSVRLECASVPVSGSTRLPHKGNYIVEFDNFYSWFSAKELQFIFNIQSPET